MVNSRFVSIDLETTGLDAEKCDIIEVGAIIDDWLFPLEEPPIFHCYIVKNNYCGQAMALSMHAEIFRRIAIREEGYTYLYPSELPNALGHWMKENGAYQIDPENPDREPRAVIAGKNFGMFDDRFLRKLKNFDEYVKYHHRLIDPAMLYWRPWEDSRPPGLKKCMERAGLEGEVEHTALEDAKIVAKLVQVAVGRMTSPQRLLKEHQLRIEDHPFNVAGTLTERTSSGNE